MGPSPHTPMADQERNQAHLASFWGVCKVRKQTVIENYFIFTKIHFQCNCCSVVFLKRLLFTWKGCTAFYAIANCSKISLVMTAQKFSPMKILEADFQCCVSWSSGSDGGPQGLPAKTYINKSIQHMGSVLE